MTRPRSTHQPTDAGDVALISGCALGILLIIAGVVVAIAIIDTAPNPLIAAATLAILAWALSYAIR